MNRIRVLLVDDQALFREGLRNLLSVQHDIEVIGEAANGEEAVILAGCLQPQVVLMDLRMPVLDGIDATSQICAKVNGCRVIVLTTFDDDEQVFEALRAGAAGYLLKDSPPEIIGEAIRATARGESFLQPCIAAKLVAEFSRLSRSRPACKSRLSEPLSGREREVLQKLAEGKSNKEIGAVLSLAEGTVKNHLSNIFGKMGVLDRTQAALLARELDLI
jgi:DNA-binding NarL/FixJ family response regulator